MNLALREAFGNTLVELKDNPSVVVLDADLGHATKSLKFREVCPQRYINMGISEQDMVGTAAGLATCGLIPIAVSFSIFIAGRAFEQVRNAVAYPNLNVKLVGTHAGITIGPDGGTHQAIEDIALMQSVPNMTVLCPADDIETRAAIIAAIEYKGPVYIRISRMDAPTFHKSDYSFRIGKGEIVKQGKSVAIIATGLMTVKAIEAAEILNQDGIDAMVVNICSIKPIDRDLIIAVAMQTGKVVTVEEHSVFGGLGATVCQVLSEACPTPTRIIGVQDRFGQSGSPADLLEEYGLTVNNIIEAVKQFI